MIVPTLAPMPAPEGAVRSIETGPADDDAFARALAAAAPVIGVQCASPSGAETPLPCPVGSIAALLETAERNPAETPVTAARMFNELGFFGKATASPPERAASTADAPMAAPSQAARTLDARAACAASTPATGETGRIALENSSVREALPQIPRVSQVRTRSPETQPVALFKPLDRAPSSPDARAPAKDGLRRERFKASSPVDVVMHSLDAGLAVAVRAEALAPADGIKLRDEIAALLARHGFTPRAIRILVPAVQARPTR